MVAGVAYLRCELTAASGTRRHRDLLTPLNLTIRIRWGTLTLPVCTMANVLTVSRLPRLTMLLNGMFPLTSLRAVRVFVLTAYLRLIPLISCELSAMLCCWYLLTTLCKCSRVPFLIVLSSPVLLHVLCLLIIVSDPML